MKSAFLFALLLSLHSAQSHASYSPDQIRNWADVLLLAEDKPEELNDPNLSSVTREFGPAVISMQNLPYESAEATAQSTPWSSWWFPKIDRDLFDDGMGTSTLEKYDIVRTALTRRKSAAAQLEKSSYNQNGPRWEGLCDAWAIASILFPEPKANRVYTLPSGTVVSFSVSDQKALLLKTVDMINSDALKLYGQRFTGNADGWIFPDLFPHELHRFVEVQLFQRKQPFVMDHDPTEEVWSEPVYKANFKVQAVPGRNDAVSVRLWLYSATTFATKQQKDQTGIRELVREYDYILYGTPDGRGNLVVSSGVWMKGDLVDSRRDHPDFVYTLNNSAVVKRMSRNSEIDPAVVDRILGR